MSSYILSVEEQTHFQDVLQRNVQALLKGKKGILGVGIGLKEAGGELTDTVSISVLVEKKNDSKAHRIPKFIERVPTDIVEVGLSEDQLLGMLGSERTERFDTIQGGIEINNRNLCKYSATVLGGVVFCKSNGQPLGITAQHGIGFFGGTKPQIYDEDCECGYCDRLRQKRKLTGFMKSARIGDPINQPSSYDKSKEIGELFKTDTELDIALVKLNNKRKSEAKIQGIADFIDKPILATLNMEVECSGRYTQTKGKVVGIYPKFAGRAVVKILFKSGYAPTRGGDSGALWLQSGTARPIGVHTTLLSKMRGGKKVPYAALATCVSELEKIHSVTFQPPDFRKMAKSLSRYHTEFVKSKRNLFALKYRVGNSGQSEPLSIVKYDHEFDKLATETFTEIRPVASGVAATLFKKQLQLAWRGPDSDKIFMARINRNLKTKPKIRSYQMRTRFRPAVCTYKDYVLVANLDYTTERVEIAVSKDGKSFFEFQLATPKGCSGISMTNFQDRVVVAWVDKRTKQISLKKIWISNDHLYEESTKKLPSRYQIHGTPYLESGLTKVVAFDANRNDVSNYVSKLFLAFTSTMGSLQILESTDGTQWNEVSNCARPSSFSPSLLHHENRIIWTRQTDESLQGI